MPHPLAVWRDQSGAPCVVRDRCPHRSMKLSVGRILDGDIQCILHGLRFDGKGTCTLIPWEKERCAAHDRVGVQAYPAQELGGYIWAYLGDAADFSGNVYVQGSRTNANGVLYDLNKYNARFCLRGICL